MQRLDDLTDSIDAAMQRQLRDARRLLKGFGQRTLLLAPTTQLAYYRRELLARQHAIDGAALRTLKSRRERLHWIATGLKSVDPKNLLAKGYSILFNEKDGSIINSTLQVEREQEIKALLSDGEMRLRVVSSE